MLQAIGTYLERETARISFSRFNTLLEVDMLVHTIADIYRSPPKQPVALHETAY